MLERLLACMVLIVGCGLLGPMPSQAQVPGGADVAERHVHMVVWRGCEEACKGFIRYFEDRDLPVRIEVTDVARNKDLLPEVQAHLIAERPDLVVTWGQFPPV